MEEDYEPRTKDHLVEPLFGGLGVRAESPAAEPESTEPTPGLVRRILSLLLWWRR